MKKLNIFPTLVNFGPKAKNLKSIILTLDRIEWAKKTSHTTIHSTEWRHEILAFSQIFTKTLNFYKDNYVLSFKPVCNP